MAGLSDRRACCAAALLLSGLWVSADTPSQTIGSDGDGRARAAAVRGIYNWVHTTGDAERAFAFYRDVFDIELAPSPFYGDPDAPPPAIRSVSEAGSDPLVWRLTNTEGARFRTAFMRAGDTPFGLELAEFFDIPRNTRAPRPWDPGASILIFEVRDLADVIARLESAGARFLSPRGAAVATSVGPSVLVRNPDGYLVQAVQASPGRLAGARTDAQVIDTAIGLSVDDTEATLEFYRDLLGFGIRSSGYVAESELALFGLDDGVVLETRASIPGTDVTVVFVEPAAIASR